MQHLTSLTASALLLLSTTSCATLLHATRDTEIEITSTPTGATFTDSHTKQQQVTPATIILPNGENPVTISFVLDGYEPQQELVKTELSPLALAGFFVPPFLLWPLLDVIIKSNRIPEDVHVNLAPAIVTEGR